MINEPRLRGRPPKYLDRALTAAERRRLYRLRKKGVTVPVYDPLASLRAALADYTVAVREAYPVPDEALRSATADLVKQVQIILGEY